LTRSFVAAFWHVSGSTDIRTFEERINLNLSYFDNWSLSLDANILLPSIPTVLSGRRAQ